MNVQQCLDELDNQGFCVLKDHLAKPVIQACKEALWPVLSTYLVAYADQPNRGPHRHFLAMPFSPPCYAAEFFFDPAILSIVQQAMDERIVADQWGCDIPVAGSSFQAFHADYQRPLFAEWPALQLPTYMLVVSFGLTTINLLNGPIEIAPATHKMPRDEALQAVQTGKIRTQLVPLAIGDVLIRHPWALHRGTPNQTDAPRPLLTIRYVRHWYADDSREVGTIPDPTWQAMSPRQRSLMRFPVEQLD